jgi:hypothetical protein
MDSDELFFSGAATIVDDDGWQPPLIIQPLPIFRQAWPEQDELSIAQRGSFSGHVRVLVARATARPTIFSEADELGLAAATVGLDEDRWERPHYIIPFTTAKVQLQPWQEHQEEVARFGLDDVYYVAPGITRSEVNRQAISLASFGDESDVWVQFIPGTTRRVLALRMGATEEIALAWGASRTIPERLDATGVMAHGTWGACGR